MTVTAELPPPNPLAAGDLHTHVGTPDGTLYDLAVSITNLLKHGRGLSWA